MHRHLLSRLIPRSVFASLLLVSLACNSTPTRADRAAPSVKADPDFNFDARQAIGYLASDELQGRGIGTSGIDKAADYIADAFRKLGLQPAPGMEGYFQPFTIPTFTAPDPTTTLTFGGKAFAVGKDFSAISLSGEGRFDATPVVFAGYGVSSKEHHYDDYASLDVKDKVVLVLRYEPHDEKGVSRFTKQKDNWSDAATLMTKATVAASKGAKALLLVNPPALHDDETIAFNRGSMDEKSSLPFFQIKQPLAEAMLKEAGARSLKDLQSAIDSSGHPASFALDHVTVSGQVKLIKKETPAKNVVALLPGKGSLASEYVVIGAHYDHLGMGGPGSLAMNKREIHNGADDNASGVAAMLELAEHYSRAGTSGRSMLFVAFSAEESGLIGSRYFVNHCPVPLEKIAYMLNMDMVGRVRNHVLSVGGLGTAASFDAIIKKADDASPLVVKNFSRGGFGPSDHMSFAVKKIPVLFFWTGYHPDYHKPTDDADKINYDGLEQVVKLAVDVVDAMETHARETYVSADDNPHSALAPGGSGGGSRASLGVLPAYGAEVEKGVLIDQALPGTAAEEAGLKGGDVIIQFGNAAIDSLQGLTDALGKAKPGEKVKIIVIRGGKNLELSATLRERKG